MWKQALTWPDLWAIWLSACGNLYVMSLVGADVALEVSESERRELTGELPLFGSDRLARLLGVLGDLSAELKTSTNPRLSFEIALTRMVRPTAT